MENKKPLLFAFTIISIILGTTLFKEFNFDTLQFNKPKLALVYGICFLASTYFWIKNNKDSTKD